MSSVEQTFAMPFTGFDFETFLALSGQDVFIALEHPEKCINIIKNLMF